nr:hypothetical protein 32 [bacterium]
MDFPKVVFYRKKSVKTSNRASQNRVKSNPFTDYTSAILFDESTDIDSFLASLTMDNLFD